MTDLVNRLYYQYIQTEDPMNNRTRMTTEIINHKIIDLIPEHHRPRAWNQIWFALVATWKEQGDPSEMAYTHQYATATAVTCVNRLVQDGIITDTATELKAQDEIIKVLEWTRLCYSP